MAALGHTPEKIPAVAATCTETGLTEGSRCSVCGTILTAQQATPALGHSWGGWIVVQEASVAESGIMRRTCDRCGETEETPIPRIDTGDLNDSGSLDDDDLLVMLACLHGTQDENIKLARADLDGNGSVDYEDFLMLLRSVRGDVTLDPAAMLMENGYSYEASLILQYAVGLIDTFPAITPIPVLDGDSETDADEADQDEEEPETEESSVSLDADPESEDTAPPEEPASQEQVQEPLPALLPEPEALPEPEEIPEDREDPVPDPEEGSIRPN